ncbi:MAG TPA: hypothetical protein VNW97_14375 [Candidatus Saccharimonadales bacterium]|jgi:hypothetical protein|nr:hypothetical protein [Candidatus Saccharimonadales bacterium]
MSFGFSSIGHFFARLGREAVHVTKAAGPILAKIDVAAESAKPLVEGITNVILPGGVAVAIEDAAYNLFGQVAHVVSEAGDVATAKGANISLDQQFVKDFKELLPYIKNFALNKGIVPPPVEEKAKSS